MRNANAEPNAMPPPTPRFRQASDGVAHFERHEDRLECGVLDWNRIIEHHHHTVARVALKCSAILDDARSDCLMVLTQERHHIFRVRTLREAGEAAQVAEERGYLPAMAFELLLRPGRDNQISYLRRQETSQPSHAFDFAYLGGDPVL